ncbi:hypothetical protein JCM10213_004344 [Rhodosporidiobolus nylandii]
MLSFSPADLFSPTQSTSAAPQAVPTSSVALLGPLPTSSLLHLALNHLRPEEERKQDASPLSETVKGKRRVMDEGSMEEEDVPLHGRKTRMERRVLIVTPDQDVLRDELSKESDVSLFGARRSGETARLLDLVDIRHLPSSAHLTYFLSTCYTSSSSSAVAASSAYLATNPKTRLDPSYLPYEPTLVVLHAPSDYLEEPANQGRPASALFRDQPHTGPATTHHILSLHPSPYLPRPASCPEKVEVEFSVSEVAAEDPDGEEGGVRIEVLRSEAS